LTTVGHKSGRELTHPVQLIVDGDQRWLVAPYGEVSWVHNARAAGTVRLRRGREDREWTIHELSPHEAAPVLRRYVRIAPIVLPYFDAKLSSPIEDFEAEAPRHPVFRLEPVR
jgi:deazaflavin-dependent oxidoreductase (nitroreductase family)